MYTKLTKTIVDRAGHSKVACVRFNTNRCLLHSKDVANCASCPFFSKIQNRLREYEDMIDSKDYVKISDVLSGCNDNCADGIVMTLNQLRVLEEVLFSKDI